MAVTNEQIVFAIEANTKAVESGLQSLEVALKDVNGAFKKTEDESSKFGSSIIVLNQALELSQKVFTALIGPLSKSVSEFIVADQAVNRLKNSLKLVGTGNIEAATKDFENFATSIQNTTTVADDTVLQLAAQAKAIGLTDEATKKLITASIDLAAATGGEVINSFDQLLSSYKGQGKALAKYSQELGMVTEAEFKAGKGIEVIGQKFKDFGVGEINTISGAFKQFNNIVGDVFEDIGKTLSDGFDFRGIIAEAKNLAVNLKAEFQSVSDAIIPIFKTIGNVIKATLRTIVEIDIKPILIAFSTISAVGVATFTALNFAAVKAAASAIAAWTAAAAPFIGIVAGITTVIAAVEILILNFGKLSKIAGLLATGNFKQAFEETNFGTAGKAINGVTNAFKAFGTNLSDVEKEAKKASESTKEIGDSGKKAASGLATMSLQGKQMLDELAAKIEEVKRKNSTIGAGVTDVINLQVQADQASLDVIKKKLQAEGVYNETAKKNLKELNALYAQGGQLQVSENQRKLLEDITNQTKDLAAETAKKDALTIDGIDIQLKRQLELLDLKEDQLKKDKLLTEGIKGQLDTQRELLKTQAKQSKNAAPTVGFESTVKAGNEIAKNITDSFSGILGMANAVASITSAINSVVEAIPGALNAISGTINKITNFPTELANAVTGLVDAFNNFLTNFPDIMNKAIDNIANSLVGFFDRFPRLIDSFFAKLPSVIQRLFDAIPSVIVKIMESLPSIIQSLIRSLSAAMPRIAVMFTVQVAKNLPKILLASMKSTFIEIPIAIAKGIRDALFGFSDDFVDSLTDIDIIDPKAIGTELKKLTGEASRLFKVSDLTEGIADPVTSGIDKINEAVNNGVARIQGLWSQFIEALNQAWMWVRTNIIDPLVGIVSRAWQWVVDKILLPLSGIVMRAWTWVVTNVLAPIYNIVTGAFQWVIDNVLSPLAGYVSGAFQWVIDNILSPLAGYVSSAFEPIKNIGSDIFNSFKSAFDGADLTEVFKNLGVAIWDGLKSVLDPSSFLPGGGVSGGVGDFIDSINPFAKGGVVSGTASVPGNSLLNDNILALLSPGEAVIPRDKMADPKINALVSAILGNKIELPKFAEGGMTTSFGSSIAGTLVTNEPRASVSNQSNSNQVFDIKINITNNDKMDDNFIRNKLVPTIKNELRRASLDGQFILDAKGIRK